jgi:hypothetical protein
MGKLIILALKHNSYDFPQLRSLAKNIRLVRRSSLSNIALTHNPIAENMVKVTILKHLLFIQKPNHYVDLFDHQEL